MFVLFKITNGKIILDGQVVAEKIKRDLQFRVQKLKGEGIHPTLATILVGNNPSSETYVKMKGNACEKNGIKSIRIHLSEDTTMPALLQVIKELNEDDGIRGIILQHPIPSHLNERLAFEAIAVEKDVDGLTSAGYGKTALGFGTYPSCTPAAILEMLQYNYRMTTCCCCW